MIHFTGYGFIAEKPHVSHLPRIFLHPVGITIYIYRLFRWSSTCINQIPQVAFNVGNNVITSSSVVRDLGIYLDSSLTMTTHISRTVSNCFAALRQVCSVRRSLPMRVMSSLVTALVLTRLDCGNAMLAGLPTCQLNRLQSVLHAAARLVCGPGTMTM